MSQSKEPNYKLVALQDSIEIRDYPAMILAEVSVKGERKEAIQAGFKLLASYIFGNNTSSKKNQTDNESEKIAMTKPVFQQRYQDQWKIRFVMPSEYDLETLPKPLSSSIHLIAYPPKRFAVIRFSGIVQDNSIQKHADKLNAYLAKENQTPIGEMLLAFYNPPWTPSFLRRNEILIEIGIGP